MLAVQNTTDEWMTYRIASFLRPGGHVLKFVAKFSAQSIIKLDSHSHPIHTKVCHRRASKDIGRVSDCRFMQTFGPSAGDQGKPGCIRTMHRQTKGGVEGFTIRLLKFGW